MLRSKWYITLLIIVTLLFTSCNSSGITKGVVIEKNYSPQHTVSGTTPLIIGKTIIFLPKTTVIAESYTIVIEGVNRYDEKEQVTISLTEEEWNTLEVGDHYQIESE